MSLLYKLIRSGGRGGLKHSTFQQMNRELQALIEKQNLIHSSKLNAIRQSQGRLDNWNFYHQRSLNAAQQHQALNKISYENGKILERILKRESEYGRWETEWEKVKRIQANISRYPQVTWAGQHRVTFTDDKRSADIHNLFEGSETASTQSRSTVKLDSIPKRTYHHRKKEHSNLIDISKGLTPIQTEKLAEAEFEDKAYCTQGCSYRYCKKDTVITTTLGKTNYIDQAKYPSDHKSFSKSKTCAKCLAEEIYGGREQDDFTEQKDSSQEESKSKKSHPGDEQGTKPKNSRKTLMTYENSAETLNSIQEESDTSSCYSFKSFKENSSCSSLSSAMSETLSSVSINLKTRMASASSTSLRSVEGPVGSSHKLKISNTQTVYRGHNPSSQESSISPTAVRHSHTPVTSFLREDVSDRQNVYSSQDMSLPGSKKTNYDDDEEETKNKSPELSEIDANSSPESLVIYPQKRPMNGL
ncbi:uro-adherence factor A-like isoform X2 [Dendropsophus ebraccatus]|uniref:uro-adherence factor A-like isoform X2 n=1 Tax=Dendropsophus ebraccatus TaxID=150705 RepID=UPI003831EE56